ncbi:uncharacterized protein LOC121385770 [Gigantopelta aegis]|uniref:uncharacterized protein LOC121385770 n=1 Tax=Gigantopelta aegis TaxID=1735272 RepID=UPI001B88D205|nr:uncharacterized protein LOC121385770 [Gigantopelta aegis]
MGDICKEGKASQDKCTETQCEEDRECLTSSSHQARCVPVVSKGGHGCLSPPFLSHAKSQIISKFAVYTCHSDFKFVGASQMSTCDSSGSWAGLNGSCERVAFYNVNKFPFRSQIPGTVRDGWKVEFLGIPINISSMLVSLKYRKLYTALQIAVRFATDNQVESMSVNASTGNRLKDKPRILQREFPFKLGKPFNLTLQLHQHRIDVYVDQQLLLAWMHRLFISAIHEVLVQDEGFYHSIKYSNNYFRP